MGCGVSRSCASDLALLCLWRKPAATAPIQPLAWELPYAGGAALKSKKQTNKQKKPKNTTIEFFQTLRSRAQLGSLNQVSLLSTGLLLCTVFPHFPSSSFCSYLYHSAPSRVPYHIQHSINICYIK